MLNRTLAGLALALPATVAASPCFMNNNPVVCPNFSSGPMTGQPIPDGSVWQFNSPPISQWRLPNNTFVFVQGTSFQPFTPPAPQPAPVAVVPPAPAVPVLPETARAVMALTITEAQENLRALFTAEKAFFQEKDRYSTLVTEVGFAPERNNRYAYFLTNAPRSTAAGADPVDAFPDVAYVTTDAAPEIYFANVPESDFSSVLPREWKEYADARASAEAKADPAKVQRLKELEDALIKANWRVDAARERVRVETDALRRNARSVKLAYGLPTDDPLRISVLKDEEQHRKNLSQAESELRDAQKSVAELQTQTSSLHAEVFPEGLPPRPSPPGAYTTTATMIDPSEIDGLPPETLRILGGSVQDGALQTLFVSTSADPLAPVLTFINSGSSGGFDLSFLRPMPGSGDPSSGPLRLPDLRLTLPPEFAATLIASVEKVREAAARTTVPNNLKNMALNLADSRDPAKHEAAKNSFQIAPPPVRLEVRGLLQQSHRSAAQIAGDASAYEQKLRDEQVGPEAKLIQIFFGRSSALGQPMTR